MAFLVNQDSAHAQEMRKWEAQHSQYGPPGRAYDPNVKYPAMFYKIDTVSGKTGPQIVERREAASEVEAANLRSRGFGNGAAEGMALYEQRSKDVATAAAERAFTERTMSPQAQAEAAAVDAATIAHVPEIPETPKRRGRPKKVQ